MSTSRAFIQPHMNPASKTYRSNLFVLVENMAIKLHLANGGAPLEAGGLIKAEGVVVQKSKESPAVPIFARREVIVSCGAINSPALLMYSGIGINSRLPFHNVYIMYFNFPAGPKSELVKHKITIVKDLAGVGENLQDHLFVPVEFRDYTCASRRVTIPKLVYGLAQYFYNKTGIVASSGLEAVAFFNSKIKPVKVASFLHTASRLYFNLRCN